VILTAVLIVSSCVFVSSSRSLAGAARDGTGAHAGISNSSILPDGTDELSARRSGAASGIVVQPTLDSGQWLLDILGGSVLSGDGESTQIAGVESIGISYHDLSSRAAETASGDADGWMSEILGGGEIGHYVSGDLSSLAHLTAADFNAVPDESNFGRRPVNKGDVLQESAGSSPGLDLLPAWITGPSTVYSDPLRYSVPAGETIGMILQVDWEGGIGAFKHVNGEASGATGFLADLAGVSGAHGSTYVVTTIGTDAYAGRVLEMDPTQDA
jgi:hypothetical protein